MLLDPDMSDEGYIEDCQVCCNPIGIIFRIEDGAVVYFHSQRAQ